MEIGGKNKKIMFKDEDMDELIDEEVLGEWLNEGEWWNEG